MKKLIVLLLISIFITSCNNIENLENNNEGAKTTVTEEGKNNLLADIENTDLKQLLEEFIDAKNNGNLESETTLREKLQNLEQIKRKELEQAQNNGDTKLIQTLRTELRVIGIVQR